MYQASMTVKFEHRSVPSSVRILISLDQFSSLVHCLALALGYSFEGITTVH